MKLGPVHPASAKCTGVLWVSPVVLFTEKKFCLSVSCRKKKSPSSSRKRPTIFEVASLTISNRSVFTEVCVEVSEAVVVVEAVATAFFFCTASIFCVLTCRLEASPPHRTGANPRTSMIFVKRFTIEQHPFVVNRGCSRLLCIGLRCLLPK